MTVLTTTALGEALAARTLKHWGVKGMRWGVRRSPAELAAAAKNKALPPPSEDYARAAAAKSRPAYTLSNQEMQALITRMDLESRYSVAMAKATSKPTTKMDKAKKWVVDTMIDIGKQEVTRVAKAKTALKVEAELAKHDPALAERITPKKKKSKE